MSGMLSPNADTLYTEAWLDVSREPSVMRLYWPTSTPPSILDGSWTPPPAKRLP